MMNQETNHGITYSLSLLRNGDYSKALFWLGVKPLDFDDLHELLTNISDNQLITILEELQAKYLISPIKEAGCFVLTEGGQEFARLVMSLGVWGRQQMDENGGNDSVQVVLPDSSMEQTELLKYRNAVEQYI
ncbi:winged helix-turn-helix transcriptional regulator [Limosilactobacillus reuteri]|uniref:winged helix-turn-helix transcriptional regulator n=1 Tax=Limosilactobacillus reuteri TaxID=1598 RepID=UPI001E4A6059|nr:winged helix-turn-helix transcriptional regulator [Limosilactobacillus reuteri]MCC4435348.1 winged helix-turn-helix transcriptional regulator [Limosilactobacillus reuteri]MCC4438289.1 winged helix-turn-helix transcriptional regulator [Limosilactobacillus reuteri]MCC4442504.1 winged helix-turn-helix transcriptional regulator [Limosilactobacillus reuteri]MCC4443500.1 winged helix-turn-helix transcriptional regulator [Limosilactobacillus reuteri]MCC4446258.1 winged helix-turn-helix transcripti